MKPGVNDCLSHIPFTASRTGTFDLDVSLAAQTIVGLHFSCFPAFEFIQQVLIILCAHVIFWSISLVSVQMVQMFSHCVLGSVDEMDLDELLATKLVTFMMEHHNTIFQAPSKLHCQVEEHMSHLKRVQVSTLARMKEWIYRLKFSVRWIYVIKISERTCISVRGCGSEGRKSRERTGCASSLYLDCFIFIYIL